MYVSQEDAERRIRNGHGRIDDFATRSKNGLGAPTTPKVDYDISDLTQPTDFSASKWLSQNEVYRENVEGPVKSNDADTPFADITHLIEFVGMREANNPEAQLFVQGAVVLRDIMMEFKQDGESFQPHKDGELNQFLREVLMREVPGLSELAVDQLLHEVKGFPPSDRPSIIRDDYTLVS